MSMFRIRTWARVGLVAGVLAAATTGGCVNGTNRVVRTAVPAGIEETLRALNDPENQELMRKLANDPQMRQAAHDFVAALTGGALDGLTDDERMAKVRELSDAYIRTVSTAAARMLDEELGPAMKRAVEEVVGGAVAAALRPEHRQMVSQLVGSVTRSAVTAFTQSSGQGLRDDLGPAFSKVIADDLGPAFGKVIAEDLGPALSKALADDLGPALRKVIAEDLRPAMQGALGDDVNTVAGALVRQITKDAVLGANDGMRELGISLNREEGGMGLFGWLTLVLVLLLTILAVLLVRTIITRRHLEKERARSELMLLNVLRTIQYTDTDDPNKPPDLDALIERARYQDPTSAKPDPEGESWLRDLVTRAKGMTAARVADNRSPNKPPPSQS